MINFLSKSKSISFAVCVAQFFLFALFIVTKGFLLAAMAYDCFIAICNPFPYSVQMSALSWWQTPIFVAVSVQFFRPT
jgi:olfactory receptor